MTVHDLNSAQQRLLRYVALGKAAFPVKGPIEQFRTDYTISEQRLEEHLLRLEALGLVDLVERDGFDGRFDVEVTREGHAWVHDNPR